MCVESKRMVNLISKDDRLKMKNTKFVKNAVFYKDMFAFYDAYDLVMSKPKDALPSFCFYPNGKYCLEGICLLIKNYQSEFEFESLRLTLDYLKTLYYSIAVYSEDEHLPERSVIETEFLSYAQASKELVLSEKEKFKKAKDELVKKKNDFQKTTNKYARKLINSNILNTFSIIFMIFAFVVSSFPLMFYSFGKLTLTVASIVSVSLLVVGFVAHFLMKSHAKKMNEQANELAYVLQQKKLAKNAEIEKFKDIKLKYSKILSEKNEYMNNFSKEISKYSKKLTIDEILKRTAEYKLLSYNLKLDIENLFLSEQKQINETTSKIEKIAVVEDNKQKLVEIYNEILAVDQLYFNNEVRFSFLKKFCAFAEKYHDWVLDLNGEKHNPFDINIRALAHEEITYLKDDESLFVSSTLDKFLNTNFIKSSKVLELKGINNADSLKTVKLEFLSHFFDYSKTKNYDNLFYEKKMVGNAKVTDEIQMESQKVPVFISMKLKYIECKLNLENSNYAIINKIATDIDDSSPALEKYSSEITAPVQSSDTISEFIAEDFGDYVRYNVGGNVFVGYKFT